MQRSLVTSSIECADLFDKVSSLLHDRDCEKRSALSYDQIEDQLGRFRTWGGGLGAFQQSPATSSLDHLLRESPKVALRIQELLHDLWDALRDVREIASGDRPNRLSEPFEEDDELHSQVEPVPGSFHDEPFNDTSVQTEKEEGGQLCESQELFAIVKDTIAGLFEMSLAIRNASPRSWCSFLSLKSPSDVESNTILVGDKFPLLDAKGKQWLKERLGRMITLWKQYVRTGGYDRDKLEERLGDHRDSNKGLIMKNTTSIEKKQEGLSAMDIDSTIAVSAMPATFCPTLHAGGMQDIVKEIGGSDHGLSDLRPYVCTFEECEAKIFSKHQDWVDHEMRNHRLQWRCHLCSQEICRSSREFENHLRQSHAHQAVTEYQIKTICEASRESIDQIPASDCPFCDVWDRDLRQDDYNIPTISRNEAGLVTPFRFMWHVGLHMEQVFRLTLDHKRSLNKEENYVKRARRTEYQTDDRANHSKPKGRLNGAVKRVAIAGTCGLALAIAREIHDSTSHQLLILSRTPQPGLISQGYLCQVVDYNDPPCLKHALMGIDTVVSTVTGNAQLRLIEAAVACRVRRFAPAEFEGSPGIRGHNALLDRGRSAALALLQHYNAKIQSTSFVCGILYERFSVNGMISHKMGVNTGFGNEGDYIINARSMTALAPVNDTAQNLSYVCLTSVYDVARFVVRALDMPSWPSEMSMCGTKIAVRDLLNLVAQCRGRQYSNIEWQNPQGLQYLATLAQMKGDIFMERRLATLVETAEGRYDFTTPAYLNSLNPDIQPLSFRHWLQNNWASVP